MRRRWLPVLAGGASLIVLAPAGAVPALARGNWEIGSPAGSYATFELVSAGGAGHRVLRLRHFLVAPGKPCGGFYAVPDRTVVVSAREPNGGFGGIAGRAPRALYLSGRFTSARRVELEFSQGLSCGTTIGGAPLRRKRVRDGTWWGVASDGEPVAFAVAVGGRELVTPPDRNRYSPTGLRYSSAFTVGTPDCSAGGLCTPTGPCATNGGTGALVIAASDRFQLPVSIEGTDHKRSRWTGSGRFTSPTEARGTWTITGNAHRVCKLTWRAHRTGR